MFSTFLRTVLAIFRKDIAIWFHNPYNIAATIVPPLVLVLIQAAAASAVGRSPVALVLLDNGQKGRQMQQIFYQSDVFRITNATPQQAQVLFKNIKVSAIITIPADFTQRVDAHETSPINVTINNLNLDITDDIRRSVPDVITQFYQAQDNHIIKVTQHENDLRSQDVQLFQYEVLPSIILLLTVSGLIVSSISTAREWESYTIKEMLLSPIAKPAIVVGKVLSGLTTTFCLGLVILFLCTALHWIQPRGVYWFSTLLIIALVTLMSTGIGVTIGVVLQKIQPAIVISVSVAIYLFFLSGGIGSIIFEPTWLQNIAAYIPLTYGDHALEQAIFYNSSYQLGWDALILSLCALVALSVGFWTISRKLNNTLR